MKTCALLFSGYQTSTCLTPCQTTETKIKRVSKLDLSKPDEMRIMIKFNPTVTVTTTDFVKSTMGVFMSEVWSFLRLITFLSLISTSIILWIPQCGMITGWWHDGTLAWAWCCSGNVLELLVLFVYCWYCLCIVVGVLN